MVEAGVQDGPPPPLHIETRATWTSSTLHTTSVQLLMRRRLDSLESKFQLPFNFMTGTCRHRPQQSLETTAARARRPTAHTHPQEYYSEDWSCRPDRARAVAYPRRPEQRRRRSMGVAKSVQQANQCARAARTTADGSMHRPVAGPYTHLSPLASSG